MNDSTAAATKLPTTPTTTTMATTTTAATTPGNNNGVPASTLALLTPTETNALWTFLTQADKADVLAPEWSIFANRPELTTRTREAKEDLARATRSLMSIEDGSTAACLVSPHSAPAATSAASSQQQQQHLSLHSHSLSHSSSNPTSTSAATTAASRRHSTSINSGIVTSDNTTSNNTRPSSQPMRPSSSSSSSMYGSSSSSQMPYNHQHHHPPVVIPLAPTTPVTNHSSSSTTTSNNGGTGATSGSRKRHSQDHAPKDAKRPRTSSDLLSSSVGSSIAQPQYHNHQHHGSVHALPQPLFIPGAPSSSSSTSAAFPGDNTTASSRSYNLLSSSPTSASTTTTAAAGPYTTISVSIPESSSSSTLPAPSSSAAAAASASASTHHRHRRSDSTSTSATTTNATTSNNNNPTSGGGTTSSERERPPKPPLLTTSQKKANHIQSEQKRRANIRRGYESLCEIVPALREAIKAEEEAERLAAAEAAEQQGASGAPAVPPAASLEWSDPGTSAEGAGGEAGMSANALALARKKAKGRAVAAAFGVEEGEKVDGRAGPRSEAVVLSKSIDYIGHLETQRMGLIDRIHHLRSLLPPTHPSLPPTPIAPHIIARRRAPFIPPIQNPYRAPSELTPEERDQLEAWNEGSAAPEFDERMYEVAVWARAWDGGTGLPIPGMGLMKPGMKGFGSGGGGGGGGSGGKRGKGGDDDDEYESDDDM